MIVRTSAPLPIERPDPVRIVPITPATTPAELADKEWIVANGFGGYASGTIAGVATRRYHGLLVAALPNPAGRVMMLNHLDEVIRLPDGARVELNASVSAFPPIPLVDFRLELGLPVWRYSGRGITVERRLMLTHFQNTVVVTYRLVDLAHAGSSVRLELRPAVHFRPHDEPVAQVSAPYALHALGNRIELIAPAPLPPLHMRVVAPGTTFVVEPQSSPDLIYPVEESRGYSSRGTLYSPGRYRAPLTGGEPVAFVASTESWDTVLALGPHEAFAAEIDRRHGLLFNAGATAEEVGAELVLAADQFVIRPAGRRTDFVWARASGEEPASVIAGYHWFTDWGRDTMISLEGLTLITGRAQEAGAILRTFAHHVRNGLVPNLFPEGENEALYHTADATLWFLHAIDRYARATGDERTLRALIPLARDIVEQHVLGTWFGIGMDPADGLLRQGAPGYQLTWMDAKAGDWVVTPRRGKAVEINALWFNALCLLDGWLERVGDRDGATAMHARAETVRASFNRRFWNDATGHLHDVVDGEAGDDPACRPNQLFAIALPNPVLDRSRWASVLAVVERDLLTPVGLRSLAPTHPDYKPTYHGDLRTRDAAYHQGTVWSWLIGPYIDARLKVRPDDRAGARRALEGLVAHLDAACIGQVSEVFDAEPPYTPRGCCAQAWGVAELLRAWVLTAP
jgi:predicted glycogen debranching enzyme